MKQIECDKLFDHKFWTKINPNLHVDDKAFQKSQSVLNLSADSIKKLGDDLLEEGYFQSAPVQWELPMSEMAETVTKFFDMNWPEAFVFVYDEFFLLPYKLSGILSHALGEDFKQLPDFWAWYLDHLRNQSGWAPHRDKGIDSLMSDGKPRSLTIWIPLTDVTPLNGCIYLVPAQWDPYFINQENVTKFEYQNIRALPAKAGSVLAWNQAVFHWGGKSSRKAPNPRISIAFEFQRGDIPPYNEPLLSVYPLPDLRFRLKLIAKQIMQYKHMYKLRKDLENIVQELLKL